MHRLNTEPAKKSSLTLLSLGPPRGELAHDAAAKREHADYEDHSGDHRYPLAERSEVILETVFARRERRLQAEEVQHLRERERDHGEVDALTPDREQAGDQPQHRGRGGPERDCRFGRQAPDSRGVRGYVAAHAEEHRMAER